MIRKYLIQPEFWREFDCESFDRTNTCQYVTFVVTHARTIDPLRPSLTFLPLFSGCINRHQQAVIHCLLVGAAVGLNTEEAAVYRTSRNKSTCHHTRRCRRQQRPPGLSWPV